MLLFLGLFLLPLAIYAVYFRAKGGGSLEEFLVAAPLLRLFFAGTLLVAAMIATFASFTGEPITGTYRPPVYKDGKIVPGHVE